MENIKKMETYGVIEVLEELALALVKCEKSISCDSCEYASECFEIFGKCDEPALEIRQLAAQCRAFNNFARANREDL